MPLLVCRHHHSSPPLPQRETLTGGKIKPVGARTPLYGDWNPNLVRDLFGMQYAIY